MEAGFGLQIAGESGLCPTIVESGSYYSVSLQKLNLTNFMDLVFVET